MIDSAHPEAIDELPQFLNCLMGQLSCVGPRPPLPSEVAQYDARAMRRLSVKPGLTGYWQVRGRSDTTFDDMVAMDLAYIEERSFLVDLRVVAGTAAIMLRGGALTRCPSPATQPFRPSSAEASVPVARGGCGRALPHRAPAAGRLAYRFAKRAFDVAFSLAVVLLCLVPVALLCAAIRLESEGSPLYRQRRVGLEGRPIGILKLRTMVADSDDVERHLDPVQLEQWRRERKVDGDPRVTKVGRFLRKTSLDELPQFLNVLAGQMSVIGPRPVVEEELAAYGDDAGELLSAKPGITGWWQVQARNDATYGDGSRQELELFYVRNASLAMDARVFLKTFSIMFGKDRTGR